MKNNDIRNYIENNDTIDIVDQLQSKLVTKNKKEDEDFNLDLNMRGSIDDTDFELNNE